MPLLAEVCRHVRSKNAGPFWITVDMFFTDETSYARWADSPALQPDALAQRLGISAAGIKRFAVPQLNVLKVSYPRANAQGGTHERDMHGGQQYVRLLDLSL
jgi:hypothetical protein